MNLSRFFVDKLAALLHVPSSAVRMLRAANSITGIDTKSLPTELVSLNALQFARGLLNYSFFQSHLEWVMPYWAVRQYDPADPSFIPRSHLGLSMNVTHRNWTAVGSPECPIEPIVDPRGLVTPFRDEWSIDTWIDAGGAVVFPSRHAAAQSLVDHYPAVKTEFMIESLRVQLLTFVDRSLLMHAVRITNLGSEACAGSMMLAIRPFNPEGVGLISSFAYDDTTRSIRINGRHDLFISHAPSQVWCSTYDDGDSAAHARSVEGSRVQAECEVGMANGFVRFPFTLAPGARHEFDARLMLESTSAGSPAVDDRPVHDHLHAMMAWWNDLLDEGAAITTPDPSLNSAVKSNLAALLLLSDGDTITPGPAAYHHFWFRDAAFMINALDAFGHHRRTRPIIERFFAHQESDGYFRSQKGEWDSNGQVLWTIGEHVLLSDDKTCLNNHLPALRNAVQWIGKKRLTHPTDAGSTHAGLMPAGLSAEHLGLADHYYWDNFWSLAGIRSFVNLCSIASAYEFQQEAQQVFDQMLADVQRAIEGDRKRLQTMAIPAAPSRELDCGMIGSLSALYPLRLFELGSEPLESTVQMLTETFCRDELFFQQFVHSGLNIYLSLQIAHAWLVLGDRNQFLRILNSVMHHASPTGTFPEAIHPQTGGGAMGDGHHGWAAAEFVLAVRSIFILEMADELRLLWGTPVEWYANEQQFSLRRMPTHSGVAAIAVYNNVLGVKIIIEWEPHDVPHQTKWRMRLPFHAASVAVEDVNVPFTTTDSGETEILMAPGPCTIIVKRAAILM